MRCPSTKQRKKVKCEHLIGSMLILGWVTVLKPCYALQVLVALPVSCASHYSSATLCRFPPAFHTWTLGALCWGLCCVLFLPLALLPLAIGAHRGSLTWLNLRLPVSLRLSETSGLMIVVKVLPQKWRETISSSRLIYPTTQLICPLGYTIYLSNFFNGKIKI